MKRASKRVRLSAKNSRKSLSYGKLKSPCVDDNLQWPWSKFPLNIQRKSEQHVDPFCCSSSNAWHDMNGFMTSAEPRPNAYIPDVDLPVPKPYGQFQPFKPTLPGGSIRHIKKPVISAIEI
jgi:hypothetical protein